jgi:hypothetical protein
MACMRGCALRMIQTRAGCAIVPARRQSRFGGSTSSVRALATAAVRGTPATESIRRSLETLTQAFSVNRYADQQAAC